MNKMAKGALATGVGVALLLGGGGTLAIWNDTAAANAGNIAAGDLNLEAGTGVWTNAYGAEVDLATYRIVPGDVLSYEQDLTVTLVGDLMTANLTLDAAGVTSSFANGDVTVGAPVLKSADGEILPTTVLTPKSNGNITATASFAFDNVSGELSSVKAAAELATVTYKLDQTAVPAVSQ